MNKIYSVLQLYIMPRASQCRDMFGDGIYRDSSEGTIRLDVIVVKKSSRLDGNCHQPILIVSYTGRILIA